MAIIAHLIVGGAAKAMDFYTKAFGATEVMRMPAQDGQRLMHGHMKVGDSELFLCDDFPEMCGGKSRDPLKMGGTSIVLHQYVPSADEAIAKAAAAGATVSMPAQDMFWGDRYGQVVDPFGHTWSFAHKLGQGV
ncbi:MAG TPA: VOC family protein [Gemmataceae bacterium]|jgi:PhnB protein|nr:VOC family protein [Gemmataceae bacterium]